jgi:hypothetical protein
LRSNPVRAKGGSFKSLLAGSAADGDGVDGGGVAVAVAVVLKEMNQIIEYFIFQGGFFSLWPGVNVLTTIFNYFYIFYYFLILAGIQTSEGIRLLTVVYLCAYPGGYVFELCSSVADCHEVTELFFTLWQFTITKSESKCLLLFYISYHQNSKN